MVYACFDVGLFAAVVATTAGHFPAGVGQVNERACYLCNIAM